MNKNFTLENFNHRKPWNEKAIRIIIVIGLIGMVIETIAQL